MSFALIQSNDIIQIEPLLAINQPHGIKPFCYSASDYSCVQCFRRFSNQMELRNHAITDHNRKNRRRDSAYSSHSDKSPTQSPSLAAVPFRQTSDVPPVALSKSHFTEVSFMKRVKELALISLGRYNDRQEAPTTRLTLDEKERITSNQRSDLDKRTRTISLEVGHSPTETTEETKVEEVTRRDSSHRDDDIKSSRRGGCFSSVLILPLQISLFGSYPPFCPVRRRNYRPKQHNFCDSIFEA